MVKLWQMWQLRRWRWNSVRWLWLEAVAVSEVAVSDYLQDSGEGIRVGGGSNSC